MVMDTKKKEDRKEEGRGMNRKEEKKEKKGKEWLFLEENPVENSI